MSEMASAEKINGQSYWCQRYDHDQGSEMLFEAHPQYGARLVKREAYARYRLNVQGLAEELADPSRVLPQPVGAVREGSTPIA